MSAAVPTNAARTLMAIYDACLGAASESDAFDGFYEGGTEKLLADFAAALETLGVQTLGPNEERSSGTARVWAAVVAAKSALTEGGLDVSDYPGEDYYGPGKPKGFVVRTASPDGEAVVECPLGFQDWSGRSGLGMIVKIRRPGLGLPSAAPVVDSIYDALECRGFSRPKVMPDIGPGAGKSAWFVTFGFAK